MIKKILYCSMILAFLLLPAVAMAQTETKPAAKPEATKTTDAKPAETKPADDKPADKPVTEAELKVFCENIELLIPILTSGDSKYIDAAIKKMNMDDKRFIYVFAKFTAFVAETYGRPSDMPPLTDAEREIFTKNKAQVMDAAAILEKGLTPQAQ